jgi:hypothetical protein
MGKVLEAPFPRISHKNPGNSSLELRLIVEPPLVVVHPPLQLPLTVSTSLKFESVPYPCSILYIKVLCAGAGIGKVC